MQQVRQVKDSECSEPLKFSTSFMQIIVLAAASKCLMSKRQSLINHVHDDFALMRQNPNMGAKFM